MTSCKLIFRNVRKNIRDYLVYFLTLMLSVSLFYAFNSIHSQPALADLGATKQLLADQLGILISALSVIVAVVLSFLIVYANRFLLRRRKKELGIYMLLGMKKGRMARIFAGETLCVGLLSLVCGLAFGLALSQGLSLLSLRLFAVDVSEFQMVFSADALRQTVLCFALIFLIVMVCNVRSIAGVKLIDLLTAARKNEGLAVRNPAVQVLLLLLSVLCILAAGAIFQRYGILPSRENAWFQTAAALLAAGTVLFFFSLSSVLLTVLPSVRSVYLRGLNAFLCRQIGSKIRTDFLTLSVVCGLLTVALCGISVGVSSAVTMNEASKAALPFDLNVWADVDVSGDTDIAAYLRSRGVDLNRYASEMTQITLYESELTYADLFEGQDVRLWPIDSALPDIAVNIVSLSDFNRSLALQGKEPVSLEGDAFLINCNYKGTLEYITAFLRSDQPVTLGGVTLRAQSAEVLNETFFMSSVGNNDRGSLIVPDAVARTLTKAGNMLLVQYREDTDSDEVLQQMIPIGLEWETEGYRYTEKNMLNEMYYGSCALLVLLCCYIGLIFLLVCAVLLSLKQLTETADNVYRYGLLQRLGAPDRLVYGTLFQQVSVFFLAPLPLAGLFSAFGMGKVTAIVSEFMNMHISTHIGVTVLMLLLVYGGYFLATYCSCRQMVRERPYTGEEG